LTVALCGAVRAEVSAATPTTDMRDMMMNLMETMRLQQKAINDLTERMNATDEQIKSLRELVKQQSEAYEAAQKSLQKTQEVVKQTGAINAEGYRANDEYSAELEFKNAYSVQHTAYFEVRRRDQGPYIRQAIKEFERVVQRYPRTRWADEAQVRVARLYHKLGDDAKSVEAYQKLVQMFPESEYLDEAHEHISEYSH